MNCEQCQELIHDFVDGSISRSDESILNTHLNECLDCESVRHDLTAIVDFCHKRRGEYEAPPNEQALWLRIRNVIEAEQRGITTAPVERQPSFLGRIFGRTWELSLPQLATFTAAIVLLVSLATVVGLRRWNTSVPTIQASAYKSNVDERVWQREQVINYWNQRVELNKARWSPDMRDAFDRNMQVINQAVANSMDELKRNPHDEFSEQMLNDALNDKLALLKEFSDL